MYTFLLIANSNEPEEKTFSLYGTPKQDSDEKKSTTPLSQLLTAQTHVPVLQAPQETEGLGVGRTMLEKEK